jgi:hypothetical protein
MWARLADVAEVNPNTSFDGLSDDVEIPFVPMAALDRFRKVAASLQLARGSTDAN